MISSNKTTLVSTKPNPPSGCGGYRATKLSPPCRSNALRSVVCLWAELVAGVGGRQLLSGPVSIEQDFCDSWACSPSTARRFISPSQTMLVLGRFFTSWTCPLSTSGGFTGLSTGCLFALVAVSQSDGYVQSRINPVTSKVCN